MNHKLMIHIQASEFLYLYSCFMTFDPVFVFITFELYLSLSPLSLYSDVKKRLYVALNWQGLAKYYYNQYYFVLHIAVPIHNRSLL